MIKQIKNNFRKIIFSLALLMPVLPVISYADDAVLELVAVERIDTDPKSEMIHITNEDPLPLTVLIRNLSASSAVSQNEDLKAEWDAIESSDEYKEMPDQEKKELRAWYQPVEAPGFKLNPEDSVKVYLLDKDSKEEPLPSDAYAASEDMELKTTELNAEESGSAIAVAVESGAFEKFKQGQYVLKIVLEPEGQKNESSAETMLDLKLMPAGAMKSGADQIIRLKLTGEINRLKNDYKAMIDLADQILALDDQDQYAWLLKGDGHRGLEENESALDAYLKALNIYAKQEYTDEPPLEIYRRLKKLEAADPDLYQKVYESKASKFKLEIFHVTGKAIIISQDGSEESADIGDLIESGDRIKTAADGEVEATLDNEWKNIVRIASNTNALVHAAAPLSVSIEEGEALLKLDEYPKNSAAEIRTPVAIAGVRGSILRVFHSDRSGTDAENHSKHKKSKVYLHSVDEEGSIDREMFKELDRDQSSSIREAGGAPSTPEKMPKAKLEQIESLINQINQRIEAIRQSGTESQAESLEALNDFSNNHTNCPTCNLMGVDPDKFHQ